MTDLAPGAPAVVAVLLIAEPGDRFDEVLIGLADQDYPNVRCLVMDLTEGDAVADRVRAVLPKAVVRRANDRAAGLGAAANEVRTLVAGSGFLWFVREDVIADSDVARLLLEEAYRSNVGIAGAKMVEADEPRRLLSVGYGIDKFAERWQPIQPGELDQEQHDAVQDRFFLSSDCLLVRSDLFDSLGGFDESLGPETMDLDLCWRAHLSGARVLVAPAARARRLPRPLTTYQRDHAELRIANDRLRTILGVYGIGHLIRVLPQALLVTFIMAVANLLVGHWRRALALLAAWPAMLAHVGEIHRKRKAIAALRKVSDSDLRRLQQRGSARLGALLRGSAGGGEHRVTDALADSGRSFLEGVRSGRRWPAFLTGFSLIGVSLFGSRSIVFGRLATFGRFVPFPDSPRTYLREFMSDWRPQGLGRVGAAPTGLGLTGLFGVASFGHMGLARTLTVLVPLILGPVGVWHLLRPAGSLRGRVAGVSAYVLVPLATNAVTAGRWTGVLAYGAFPYLINWLIRCLREEPFLAAGDRGLSPLAAGCRIALLGGILAAFVPVMLVPLLVTVVVLAAGVARKPAAARRVLIAGGIGLAGSVILQLPWALQKAGMWTSLTSMAEPARAALRVPELLRFQTGTHHQAWMGWLVLAGLGVGVVVGQGWRFVWAARMAVLAVVSFATAWLLGSRGVPIRSNEIEVMLVPALVAVAVGNGLAVSAFEQDLHGHRLSWRQPVAFAAACAVVVGLLPGVRGLASGRWGAPTGDEAAPLRLAGAVDDQENARTLWLGDPGSLPAPGWALTPGFAFTVTSGLEPRLDDLWPTPPARAERVVSDAIDAASANTTHRLGQLLGPSAVRYVIVRHRRADGTTAVTPVGLSEVLRRQLDLRELVLGDDQLQVFENQSWLPSRAQLSANAAKASRQQGTSSLIAADLSGSAPVLIAQSSTLAQGPVQAGEVYLAATTAAGWHLGVDGVEAIRHPAFGWANSFTVPSGGSASLHYTTSPTRLVWIVAQIALWTVALVLGAGSRLWLLPRNRRVRTDTAAKEHSLAFDLTVPSSDVLVGASTASGPMRGAGPPTWNQDLAIHASESVAGSVRYSTQPLAAAGGHDPLWGADATSAAPLPEESQSAVTDATDPSLTDALAVRPGIEQTAPTPEGSVRAEAPAVPDDIDVHWASDRTDEERGRS